MTAAEFDGIVLQGKSGSAFICDVRPFGKRQAEALDYYLREIAEKIESREPFLTDAESIVVWCDHGTCFQFSTIESYRKLWRANFPIKITEKRHRDA